MIKLNGIEKMTNEQKYKYMLEEKYLVEFFLNLTNT